MTLPTDEELAMRYRLWWTPNGVKEEYEVTEACPYYLWVTHGMERMGAFGPRTCMGGCVDEPRCMK